MKKEPRTKKFLRYIIAHPGTTAAGMIKALGCVQYYPVYISADNQAKAAAERAALGLKPSKPRVDGRSTFETVKTLVKKGLVRKAKEGTKVRLYPIVPNLETMHEISGYDA